MGPIMSGRPPLRYSASTTAICCDGNSLTAGIGGNLPYPTQLAALAPLSGVVTVVNRGINGQTTQAMIDSASDVNNSWVDGKTNVLVLWEGTNQIVNLAQSGAQAYAKMAEYIAARKAIHPWKVILLTCLPRQGSSQASTDSINARLDDYNALLRANYNAMGADVLVDVRTPGSIFNLADYLQATFEAAYSTGVWAFGETGAHVHLSNNGYAVIAQMVAAGLRRLPAR